MALPRFVLAVLAGVALGAPFVLAARAAEALLAPAAEASVAALLRITEPLAVVPADPPEDVEVAIDESTELTAQRTSKPAVRRPPPLAKAPAGLFVSRATVLKLAQSSARPRGSFVSQTPQHPAGLRLSGVAALGIGLQDGDLLIEAMGRSPRASAEIVGAVLEARAQRADALSGTLWRRGQTFRITVQQPY